MTTTTKELQQKKQEILKSLEKIHNLKVELEHENARYNQLFDDMKYYNAPEIVIELAEMLHQKENEPQKYPEEADQTIPASDNEKNNENTVISDIISFEDSDNYDVNWDGKQDKIKEDFDKQKSIDSIANLKLTNNLLTRGVALVKAGLLSAWDKLGLTLGKADEIYCNDRINIHEKELEKYKELKEKFEKKIQPKLEKRLQKHNKWRVKHHLEPFPKNELHHVLSSNESSFLLRLDRKMLLEQQQICLCKKELEKIHETITARQNSINYHLNVAKNKYIVTNEKKIIDVSDMENQQQLQTKVADKTIISEPETPVVTEPSKEESKQIIKEPETDQKKRLEILLTNPSNSREYKEIAEDFRIKNKKTGKTFLPKDIDNTIVAMAYVITENDKTESAGMRRFVDAVNNEFPQITGLERNDIAKAIDNPTGFVQYANNTKKDTAYKSKILQMAMKVKPEIAEKALATGIKDIARNSDRSYRDIISYIKDSVIQTKGEILDHLSQPFTTAIDDKINIERTMNAVRREEQYQKNSEKTEEYIKENTPTPNKTADTLMVNADNVFEEPINDELEAEITTDNIETVRRITDNMTEPQKIITDIPNAEPEIDIFDPNVIDQVVENAKNANAMNNLQLIEDNLSIGTRMEFILGNNDFRAEKHSETGALFIEKFDLETEKYIPQTKEEILNLFKKHPKEISDAIKKDLLPNTEKELDEEINID